MNPGLPLYARSRALPQTLAALAATTGFAIWAADALDAFLDPLHRAPVVTLAPLGAAAVIGASLRSHSEELDRTAVRPWWPRRLAWLASLTAVAALVLPLAVLGHAQTFGPPAMIRNVLGCTGLTALSAVFLSARLSWLPACAVVSAAAIVSSGARGPVATLWAWPLQPGAQPAAWTAALTVFAAGAALYAAHGARPEGPGTS
ncbi:hypothetical protein ACIQB4_13235 [Streptomyces griseoluteus]|uniref:hypothetical protein n=1 Tax=Streptomyces griseoluteus TaxID=29306 RepID=UPI0038122149